MNKIENNISGQEEQAGKPAPAYLRPDYPYRAVGEPITDLTVLQETGVLYEIRCPKCEISIRSQGMNIRRTYEKMMRENGCIGCGNRDLVIRKVDMSSMREVCKEDTCQTEVCKTEEPGD